MTQRVTVSGTFVDEYDVPLAGERIRFTPRARVRQNIEDLVTQVGTFVHGVLDDDGHVEIDLAATDDPDVVPFEWSWYIQELWPSGRSYNIPVPLAQQGTGIDLTLVAPGSSTGGQGWQIGPEGPPGPPGAAGGVQSDDVAFIDRVTQAEYDALVTPDPSTLYIIIG